MHLIKQMQIDNDHPLSLQPTSHNMTIPIESSEPSISVFEMNDFDYGDDNAPNFSIDNSDGEGTDDAPECLENSNQLNIYTSSLQQDDQITKNESLWTKLEQVHTEFQGQFAILRQQNASNDFLHLMVKQYKQLTSNVKNQLKESHENTSFTPKKKSNKRKADPQIRFTPKKSKRSAKQKRSVKQKLF